VGLANKIIGPAQNRGQQTRLFIALRRAGIISSETALTCCGKTEGGGAQIQAMMSVIAFCRAMELRYVHTPIQCLEHKEDPARWEALFRLGMGEPSIDHISYPSLP
jgi:hypothetical protein